MAPATPGAVLRGPSNSVLGAVLPGRLAETTVVYPADVVLFEGILVFYNQDIRDMFHLRLFVDTDSDVRLSRRGNAHGQCQPGPGPYPSSAMQ